MFENVEATLLITRLEREHAVRTASRLAHLGLPDTPRPAIVSWLRRLFRLDAPSERSGEAPQGGQARPGGVAVTPPARPERSDAARRFHRARRREREPYHRSVKRRGAPR